MTHHEPFVLLQPLMQTKLMDSNYLASTGPIHGKRQVLESEFGPCYDLPFISHLNIDDFRPIERAT